MAGHHGRWRAGYRHGCVSLLKPKRLHLGIQHGFGLRLANVRHPSGAATYHAQPPQLARAVFDGVDDYLYRSGPIGGDIVNDGHFTIALAGRFPSPHTPGVKTVFQAGEAGDISILVTRETGRSFSVVVQGDGKQAALSIRGADNAAWPDGADFWLSVHMDTSAASAADRLFVVTDGARYDAAAPGSPAVVPVVPSIGQAFEWTAMGDGDTQMRAIGNSFDADGDFAAAGLLPMEIDMLCVEFGRGVTLAPEDFIGRPSQILDQVRARLGGLAPLVFFGADMSADDWNHGNNAYGLRGSDGPYALGAPGTEPAP